MKNIPLTLWSLLPVFIDARENHPDLFLGICKAMQEAIVEAENDDLRKFCEKTNEWLKDDPCLALTAQYLMSLQFRDFFIRAKGEKRLGQKPSFIYQREDGHFYHMDGKSVIETASRAYGFWKINTSGMLTFTSWPRNSDSNPAPWILPFTMTQDALSPETRQKLETWKKKGIKAHFDNNTLTIRGDIEKEYDTSYFFIAVGEKQNIRYKEIAPMVEAQHKNGDFLFDFDDETIEEIRKARKKGGFLVIHLENDEDETVLLTRIPDLEGKKKEAVRIHTKKPYYDDFKDFYAWLEVPKALAVKLFATYPGLAVTPLEGFHAASLRNEIDICGI